MIYFDSSTGFGLVSGTAHPYLGFNKLGMWWCAGNLGLGSAHPYLGLYKLSVWCAGQANPAQRLNVLWIG